MTIASPYLSIISLNMKGSHSPIKRQSAWVDEKTQKSIICCLQETHFRFLGHTQAESEGMEKAIPCKW